MTSVRQTECSSWYSSWYYGSVLGSSPFSRTSPYGPLVGLSSGAFGGLGMCCT